MEIELDDPFGFVTKNASRVTSDVHTADRLLSDTQSRADGAFVIANAELLQCTALPFSSTRQIKMVGATGPPTADKI